MIKVGDLVKPHNQSNPLTYKVIYIINRRATVEALHLPLTTILPVHQLTKLKSKVD